MAEIGAGADDEGVKCPGRASVKVTTSSSSRSQRICCQWGGGSGGTGEGAQGGALLLPADTVEVISLLLDYRHGFAIWPSAA